MEDEEIEHNFSEEQSKAYYVGNPKNRLRFLTPIEVIALLVYRAKQLSNPNLQGTPLGSLHPKVVNTDVDFKTLLLKEIADPEIEYPNGIMVYGRLFRVHKDLIVRDDVLDIIVRNTNDGHISFNSIVHDIKHNPTAEFDIIERQIARIKEIHTRTIVGL